MKLFNKEIITAKIINKLQKIFDPEIPVNIYDLGLIYNITFEERGNYLFCFIKMTLTSPSCPVADALLEEVKYVSLSVEEVDEVHVELTFEPQWDINRVSAQGQEILMLNGIHIPQY